MLRSMRRKLLKRIEEPNHARFLTFSCRHRLPLFANAWTKDVFIEQLILARERMGFHLIAYVVMPEHVHLIIWPKLPESPASTVLHRLKRNAAKEVVGRWRENGDSVLAKITESTDKVRFWQPGGGYDRNIVSNDEMREKIEYIHSNPVRRGLAESPTGYRWSVCVVPNTNLNQLLSNRTLGGVLQL